MGVAVNRAKYFIEVSNTNKNLIHLDALHLKNLIIGDTTSKFENPFSNQTSLLNDDSFLR